MIFDSFVYSEIFNASSDSLDIFARYDQFAQLPTVFHILNVLSVCSEFAGAAGSQQWKMRKIMLRKKKATQRVNMTESRHGGVEGSSKRFSVDVVTELTLSPLVPSLVDAGP